jgi:hypothetical protein
MLLSATDAEEIPQFTGLNRTVKLNFLPDASEEQESRLTLMKVISPSKDKIDTLYNLLCTLGSASSIVFCNHRDAVDRVHQLLADKKLLAERFHGGMEQPDRERALYKFRNGSCHVLISTDLAARGLDIPEVGHIIHYHLPVNEEAFTHRNGRTARWDATGTSYLILHTEEKLPSYILEEMEIVVLPENPPRPPKSVWATIYIGKGKKEKLSRIDIAGFLYKKGNLTREDVGAIDVKEHYAFVAVAVHRSQIAGAQPSVFGEDFGGSFGVFVVAGHYVFAPYLYFSDFRFGILLIYTCFHDIENLTRRSAHKFIPRCVADKRSAFRHSISDGEREFYPLEKLFYFRIHGCSANNNFFESTT